MSLDHFPREVIPVNLICNASKLLLYIIDDRIKQFNPVDSFSILLWKLINLHCLNTLQLISYYLMFHQFTQLIGWLSQTWQEPVRFVVLLIPESRGKEMLKEEKKSLIHFEIVIGLHTLTPKQQGKHMVKTAKWKN